MTMFPAHRQNLRKKEISLGGYGGSCGGRYFEGEYVEECLGGGSDLMAEDESRTEISNEEAQGSSSKDIHIHIDHQEKEKEKEDDGGWLQLSLASGHYQQHTITTPTHQISLGPRLVELDLLPGGSAGGETWSSQQLMMRPLTLTPAPPLPLPQQQQLSFQVPDFRGPFLTTAAAPPTITTSSLLLQPQYRGAIDSVPAAMTFTHQYDYLPFRPYPLSMTTTSTTPVSSLDQQPASASASGSYQYHGRPLHFHTAAPMDIRVVDPPRRPHSGVWFMLQASQNQ